MYKININKQWISSYSDSCFIRVLKSKNMCEKHWIAKQTQKSS